MAQLVGGPCDGREYDFTAQTVMFPGLTNAHQLGAIWLEPDESPPTWTDAGGVVHFGYKPEYVDHVYERGEDGRYHYKGIRT